jgi:hypothetical protein
MSLRRSQQMPVPDRESWLGNTLQRAFSLPQSGSFGDLLEALDSAETGKPPDACPTEIASEPFHAGASLS